MKVIKIIDYQPLNIQIKIIHNPSQKNLIFRFKPGLFYISSPKKFNSTDLNLAIKKYENTIKKYCCVKKEQPSLHIWGIKYNLIIRKANYNAVIINENSVIIYSRTDSVDILIKNFYIKELETKYLKYYVQIKNRVEELFKKNITVSFKGIKYYKSFLGRCFWQKGEIELSAYLAKYPESEISSVIAHEFAHLFIHNHSKAFKEILLEIDPYYQRHVKLIKELNKEIRKDYI